MISLVVSSIKISPYKYIVLSIQKEVNFEANLLPLWDAFRTALPNYASLYCARSTQRLF